MPESRTGFFEGFAWREPALITTDPRDVGKVDGALVVVSKDIDFTEPAVEPGDTDGSW